jgi:hypothetical protein
MLGPDLFPIVKPAADRFPGLLIVLPRSLVYLWAVALALSI